MLPLGLGGVAALDLFNDNVVNDVFHSQEPKLFYFHVHTNNKANKIFSPMARPYVQPGPQMMKAYTAGPSVPPTPTPPLPYYYRQHCMHSPTSSAPVCTDTPVLREWCCCYCCCCCCR